MYGFRHRQPIITAAPTLEDYYSEIILFGRNSASYKFALENLLLELNPQEEQMPRLSNLAHAFAKHIVTHLKQAPKQAVLASSQYLEVYLGHGIADPDQTNLFE